MEQLMKHVAGLPIFAERDGLDVVGLPNKLTISVSDQQQSR